MTKAAKRTMTKEVSMMSQKTEKEWMKWRNFELPWLIRNLKLPNLITKYKPNNSAHRLIIILINQGKKWTNFAHKKDLLWEKEWTTWLKTNKL